MRRTLIILLFGASGWGMSISAQNARLDSLKSAFTRHPVGVKKYETAFYCAAALIHHSIPEAMRYADSAHHLVILMGKNAWIPNILNLKGNIAKENKDFTAAFHYYGQALESAQKNNAPGQTGQCFINMAATHIDLGNNLEAEKLYRRYLEMNLPDTSALIKSCKLKCYLGLGKALKNRRLLKEAAEAVQGGLDLALKYGQTSEIWSYYDDLGLIYGQLGDYPAKLSYQRKAAALIPANDPFLATALNNLGNAYLAMGMPDSAETVYLRVLNNSGTKKKNLTHTYNGLSQVYFEQGNYAKALDFAELSIPLADKSPNPNVWVYSRLRKAKSLVGLQRYDEAIPLFRAMLDTMDAHPDFAFYQERLTAKNYLAQALALKEGLPDLAELISEHRIGGDSLRNFEIIRAVEQLRVEYETRIKEDSIALLNADIKIQEITIQRYAVAAVSGGILTALAVAFLALFRRKRRLEKEQWARLKEQLMRENAALIAQKAVLEKTAESLTDYSELQVVLNGNEKTVFTIKDIIYIESQGNGVQVVTTSGKHWRWQTVKNLELALPNPPFIRIHRSFIINGIHLRQFRTNRVILSNGDPAPIGVTQQEKVQTFLKKWLPDLK